MSTKLNLSSFLLFVLNALTFNLSGITKVLMGAHQIIGLFHLSDGEMWLQLKLRFVWLFYPTAKEVELSF